jgi:aminoglycoside phosphotransferase (APT) family kinase protein
MTPLFIFQSKVMICCGERDYCAIEFYAGRLTLYAPDLPLAVLNDQIVSLFSAIRDVHSVPKL